MTTAADSNANRQTAWLPVIWDAERGEYRADLPRETLSSWRCEIPCDLDRESSRLGRPAVKHCRVSVPAGDVGKLRRAIAKADVSAHDRLLVAASAAVDRKYPASIQRISRVLRTPAAETAADKEMLRQVIVQMVRRGYPVEEATTIAEEKNL